MINQAVYTKGWTQPINLIYTDTPYGFKDNFEIISKYADKLREAAFKALEEEAILVAVQQVYHSG